MNKLLVLVLLVSSQLSAQDFNSRFLVRGSKQVESSSFGLVGWMVAPNITSAPDKWLYIAGPMYQAKKWHIEVMGGVVVQLGKATKLIDIRANFSEALFGNAGLFMWSNIEWIDPMSNLDKFYLYNQINYSLVKGIFTPFIETENVFHLVANLTNDLSVGAGVTFHASKKMNMIIVHQWHNQGSNQVWFRTVINL